MAAKWPFRGIKGDYYTKITSDTTERVIVPGYEGMFTNLTKLIIANSSGTTVTVTLKDQSGGGIRGEFRIPANDTKIIDLSAQDIDNFEQLTKGYPWTLTVGSSVDSILVTALFVSD